MTKLEKIKEMVNRFSPPREYDEDGPGVAHMGNYDDCYDAGFEDGEASLAQQIRAILESDIED